jgi:hypothetical protein
MKVITGVFLSGNFNDSIIKLIHIFKYKVHIVRDIIIKEYKTYWKKRQKKSGY